MDQIFNIHLVTDQEQVDLVVLEFEDYVMTWWHQLCMDNINQESLTTSWRDIKHLMRARFVPSYHRRETLLKLQRLQQGSMCVDEYYNLMKSMLLKVGLQFKSEEEKVARFVSGLKREIHDIGSCMSIPHLIKFCTWPSKLKVNRKINKRLRGILHIMNTTQNLGRVRKIKMENYPPSLSKNSP